MPTLLQLALCIVPVLPCRMLHLNALPCSAGLLLAHLSLSTVSLLQMMCEQKGEGAPVWQDCLLSGALQLCIELQQQATLGIDKRAWLNEQHLLTVLQPWTALKELIGLFCSVPVCSHNALPQHVHVRALGVGNGLFEREGSEEAYVQPRRCWQGQCSASRVPQLGQSLQQRRWR
jgi:hypothetical protein